MTSQRKTIAVVAAIIVKEDRFLATQRGSGEFAGGWEFPGGKVEPNETPEQALAREIKEELGADISVGRHLVTAEHDYATFHLSMRCYFCNLLSDHVDLLEHSDAKWLDMDTIDTVEWLPADIQVVDAIKASGLPSC
ncbi:MAG: (deoxy)nucleoside triphosphate pyrophosphohydrolase [Eggerthellaceae bacterium]|nr:(deoxy)nucleoside triphosphate pyrophosphohydrolase [Eggerthellaceae bacterium]